MKKKSLDIFLAKALLWLPFIVVIFYTKTSASFIYKITNVIFNSIVKFLNFFYPISPYIYIVIALTLLILLLLKRDKKIITISIMTIIGVAMTCYNSLAYKEFNYNLKVEIAFVAMYILGIIFILLLNRVKENMSFEEIEKTFKKVLKAIIIYIALTFIFALITDTFYLSYRTIEQGMSGWFPVTNPLGHMIIMILPILIYYYFKERNHE